MLGSSGCCRREEEGTHTQPLQRASFTPTYSAPALLCVESRVERRIYTTRSLEPSRPRLLVGGLMDPLSSFFARSGAQAVQPSVVLTPVHNALFVQ